MAGGQAAWRDRRRSAAASHAAARQRKKDEETTRARQIVAEFVAQARQHGLTPRPLTARPYSGTGSYRTALQGWYIRRNLSLAVGTDGELYILTVARSLRARLRGAHVAPTDPPLVIGAGGGDGESTPLDQLLRTRLEAGDDWP